MLPLLQLLHAVAVHSAPPLAAVLDHVYRMAGDFCLPEAYEQHVKQQAPDVNSSGTARGFYVCPVDA